MARELTAAGYGAAALGLVVLSLLAWTGHLVQKAPSEAEPKAAARTIEAPPASPPPTPEPQAESKPPAPTAAKAKATAIVLSATRGDCWISVRAGSAEGLVLYEGTLPQGESLRFSQSKVWLRLGAASNVDILVDGRQSVVPTGTVELLLPA
jgi:hypothetical protein